MRRRRSPRPIAAGIQAALGGSKEGEGVDVSAVWGEVVEQVPIAALCRPVALADGVLEVAAVDSLVREELAYLKDELVVAVNQLLGAGTVRTVAVRTGG